MPFTFLWGCFRFVLGFVPLLEIVHNYIINITTVSQGLVLLAREVKYYWRAEGGRVFFRSLGAEWRLPLGTPLLFTQQCPCLFPQCFWRDRSKSTPLQHYIVHNIPLLFFYSFFNGFVALKCRRSGKRCCISKDQNQCIEGLFSKYAPLSGDLKKNVM